MGEFLTAKKSLNLFLLKLIVLVSILITLSSCLPTKSTVTVNLKKNSIKEPLSITVSNIKVVNNQIIITGTNLNTVNNLKIKEGATNTLLQIDSKSNNEIVANTISNVTFAVGKVFDFILSNAHATSTFTVDFSLCDATLGGKNIACLVAPTDKQVLSYDGNSHTWRPRSVNGLSYKGVWSSLPALPAAGALVPGDYFIVSVANGVYNVGDWIVLNDDGVTFEQIENSVQVKTVFGRSADVVAAENDYQLDLLGDVDLSAAPMLGDVLIYNGSKWIAGPVSGGGGGGVPTGAAGGDLAGTYPNPTIGSNKITDTHIANGAISQTKINGLATSLSGKEPAITGAATTTYFRGDKTFATLDTSVVSEGSNLYFTNARALGILLAGFDNSLTGQVSAGDTMLQGFGRLQNQINSLGTDGSNHLVKNGSDTISGTVSVTNVITATGAGDIVVNSVPLTMTSAVNKTYADGKLDKATGGVVAGVVTLDNDLKIKSGSNYVTIKGNAATAGDYNFVLPTSAGTAGYFLSTDGSGNTSWVSAAGGGAPTGAATGDLGGSYPAPSVATVGGVSAANVAAGANLANAATNANTANTIVKRDASGNFTATNVSGTVAVANGGTGKTTLGLNNLLFGNATSPIGEVASTTTPSVLLSTVSTGLPAWTTSTAGNVLKGTVSGVAFGPLNLSDLPAGTLSGAGTVNYVPYYSAASTLANSPIAVSGSSVGIGTIAPGSSLDINGAETMRGMAAPAVSPAGQGRIYFDSTANQYKISQNGGAYSNLVNSSSTPAGPVSSIQYNDAGVMAGSSNFTYNSTTNSAEVKGYLRIINGISGNTLMDGFHIDLQSLDARLINREGNIIFSPSSVQTMEIAPSKIVIGSTSALSNLDTDDRGLIIHNSYNVAGADAATRYTTPTSGQAVGDGFDIGIAQTGNVAFLNQREAAPLTFSTTNTERMRLDATGNLGIGTVTPGARLEVAGQIKITGGTPGAGKVLTSDASGLATWQISAGGATDLNGLSDADTPGTTNIFLGTNSGNPAVSGQRNTGVGINSLDLVTSGASNTAFGFNSMKVMTTGQGNTAIGGTAMESSVTTNESIAIGQYAMSNVVGTLKNTAIGYAAMNQVTSSYNVGIGDNVLKTVTSGYNVAIGNLAMTSAGGAGFNTVIGNNAFQSGTTGSYNTIIGYSAGQNNGTGALTSGSNNILIGTDVITPTPTTSSHLNIGNAIFGNLASGNVGIGINAPGAKLEVAGQIKITGGTPGVGKVLTSDASGLASWATASGGSAFSLDAVDGSPAQALYVNNVGNVSIASDKVFAWGGASSDLTGQGYIIVNGSGLNIGTCNNADCSGKGQTLYHSGPSLYSGTTSFRMFTGATETAPAYSFSNDSDTGAFSAGANTFAFATAGLERMRVDATGNVGVGTNNPGAKLEVAGQIKITGGTPGAGKVLTSDAAGLATWQTPAGGGVTSVFTRSGAVVAAAGDYTASQVTNVAAGNIAATTTQAAINELDTEKQSIANFAADVRAVILTGLSTATNAVIAATDSVLVAFGKLQAQISGQATSKADLTNVAQSITASNITTSTINGVPFVNGAWTTSGSDVYRSSGKVGIGTSSPLYEFSVATASENLPATSGSSADGGFRLFNGNHALDMGIVLGGLGAWIQTRNTTDYSTKFGLYLNPRGGGVSIGETSAGQSISSYNTANGLLSINGVNTANLNSYGILALTNNAPASGGKTLGEIRFTNATEDSYNRDAAIISAFASGSGGANSYGGALSFQTKPDNVSGVVERMRLTPAGNLGIGTTTPVAKLHVEGTITSSLINDTTPTAFDMSLGNYQYTATGCSGATWNLDNLVQGTSYTIAVQNNTHTGSCVFSDGSSTFKYRPANAMPGAGHVIYTFTKMGSFVYVSWIEGF